MTAKNVKPLTSEDEIDNCSLCLSTFTEPKILPCFHSFCLKCLKTYAAKHAKNNKFACPLCVTECLIPEEGVADLQTNFYIKAAQTRSHYAANSPCDVCEDGPRAENHCLECEQNICEQCSRTHLKMTSSRDHHLVCLVEKESKGEGNVTSKSFCDKHKTDELSFYCRKCSIPICLRCKVTAHENHPSEDLSDVASETRVLLSDMLEGAKRTLPTLHKHLNEVTTYGEHLNADRERLNEEILTQTKQLHNAVDMISDKLLEEVKDEFDVEKARLSTRKKVVRNTAKALSIQLHSANQVISFGSDADIARNKDHLAEQLKTMAKKKHTTDIIKLRMDFLASSNSESGFREMFGSLTKNRAPMQRVKVEEFAAFAVDESFKAVSCVCPTADGKAWIASGWTASLHLFYRHGLKVKTHTTSKTVDYVVRDDEDNLYMASSEQKMIGKPGPGFNWDKLVSFTGYHPRGMTMTPEGDILVCLAQSLAFQDYRPAHKNKVVRITPDGNQISEYGADGKLFMYPLRVAVNVNGDVCVADSQKRCVTVLKQSGELKATYSGTDSPDLKNPFEPRGITCDSRGHILVADSLNHSIHLLDHTCNFMQLILTEDQGVFGPYAISVDTEDFLWVGGRDAAVKVYKCLWP